jgi:chromate transporter
MERQIASASVGATKERSTSEDLGLLSRASFAAGPTRIRTTSRSLAAFTRVAPPSAIIMFAAAAGLSAWGSALGSGLLHGLMLVAVSIVAEAVFGMARSFWRTPGAVVVGLAALAGVLLASNAWVQPLVIIGGGILGFLVLPRDESRMREPGGRSGIPINTPLGVFLLLLVGLPSLQA